MKYKVGDTIKIKTWEAMLDEFIIGTSGSIVIHKNLKFNTNMEKVIKELGTDRKVTISKVIEDVEKGGNNHYKIEESNLWCWTDEMVECLTAEIIPIDNRFEILDL